MICGSGSRAILADWLVVGAGCSGAIKLTFFLFESVFVLVLAEIAFSFSALLSFKWALPCAFALAALSCSLV